MVSKAIEGQSVAGRNDIDFMLQSFAARPRMYCHMFQTGRDLVFFLLGSLVGGIFPGSGTADRMTDDEPAFRDYVYRRFNREPPRPGFWQQGEFASLLLDEFGDKPFDDVHAAIFALFRGARHDTDGQKPTQT